MKIKDYIKKKKDKLVKIIDLIVNLLGIVIVIQFFSYGLAHGFWALLGVSILIASIRMYRHRFIVGNTIRVAVGMLLARDQEIRLKKAKEVKKK